MKIVVDEILCVGHAVCEDVAPEVFHVDEAGIARVLLDELNEEQQAVAHTAMLRCPAEAITILR